MMTSESCWPTWRTESRIRTPTRMVTTRSSTTSRSRRPRNNLKQAMTSTSLHARNGTRRDFSANTSSQSRGRLSRIGRTVPMKTRPRFKVTTWSSLSEQPPRVLAPQSASMTSSNASVREITWSVQCHHLRGCLQSELVGLFLTHE